MWVLKVKVISWPWYKVIYIQNLKLAFSETTGPIKAKFYILAFRYKEMKNWWHDASHMIKMAAMPIYSKNPLKIFFSRTGRPISTKLGNVASGTPAHHSLFKWWPWSDLDLFYSKVKFGNLGFSIGKSENCWFFRAIAACDLKPTEKMNICEYWRSRSFLDLGPRSFTYKIKTCFSQKPLGQSKPNFICKLSGTRKWKFDDMMLVTWPRWQPCPYMVKTLQKSSSPELAGRFPRNLVCSIRDSSLL